VAVPCHRVGYPDGTPLLYRWGEHRRRALLEREILG
jgi:O6-methylguanine-DNA--protein-cysteine methyltransferase